MKNLLVAVLFATASMSTMVDAVAYPPGKAPPPTQTADPAQTPPAATQGTPAEVPAAPAAAVAAPGATDPKAQQTPAPAPAPAQAPPASSAPSTAIIIGALVLLALAALFLVRMVKGKDTPANPPVAAPRRTAPAPVGPPDFDSADFLRQAKSSFIRMQAAWDKADTDDLSQFTTPEIFAELKAQIGDRGPSPESTEVVTIEANVLGVETVGDKYLASVKFNGTIKAPASAPAEPFVEVWNMSKPVKGASSWTLAGIQQLS